MSTIIFRGAEFRHSDLVAEEKGPVLLAAHFRSDLTDEVLDAMGWERPALCAASSHKLTGELACNTLTLSPNDAKMHHLERVIDIDDIVDFKAFPIKNDDKEICGHGLEWVARISHADSILAFVSIALPLGRAALRADASYTAVVKPGRPAAGVDDGTDADENQPSLEFGETEEPGGQFVQAAEMTITDEGGTVLFAGSSQQFHEACEKVKADPDDIIPEVLVTGSNEVPLATAREAAGGTHAKGRRGRKAADLPSAPGDGEGGGESVEKCISDQGKGWIGNITVIERDGVLAWTVAVQIGEKVGEFESPMPPPESSPRAVLAAVELILAWVEPFRTSIDKDERFGAAAMINWALNTRANNSSSVATESSIRVARGGAR